MVKMSKEESELLASVERGEWKSVRNLKAEKRKAVLAARKTNSHMEDYWTKRPHSTIYCSK
jgi:hypothetical protein